MGLMAFVYYMGHFSKFIRPGAKRIALTCNQNALPTTAFLNRDMTVATVILNQTEKEEKLMISLADRGIDVKIPPRSILTVTFELLNP